MKRIYLILVLLLSLLGFSSAFYVKYVKTHKSFPVKMSIGSVKSKDLTLSDMIKFLDNINQPTASLSISVAQKYSNNELMQTLKNINVAAVIGMVLFGFTSLWSVFMLIKRRHE